MRMYLEALLQWALMLWIHLVGAICSIAHNLPRRTPQLSRRFPTTFGVIEEYQLCVSGCRNRQNDNHLKHFFCSNPRYSRLTVAFLTCKIFTGGSKDVNSRGTWDLYPQKSLEEPPPTPSSKRRHGCRVATCSWLWRL